MNHEPRQHAFVIAAEREQGIEGAREWVKRELGLSGVNNPDVVVRSYGLLSVEEARNVVDAASGAPFGGAYKAVIVAADRAYHEAQNALLKLFEEPPAGTYLFLILPTLGGLLPTLRSRVQTLDVKVGHRMSDFDAAEEFIRATREKRSTLIKKLTSGADDDERREKRDEVLAIVNGVEAAVYAQGVERRDAGALLSDIATLRGHLYDRSAPVRMILEHLSLVTPRDLLQ